MNPPPKSIFTGAAPETTNPENRRLTTPEYVESLAPTANASKPSTPTLTPATTPLEHPSRRPAGTLARSPAHEDPWTLRTPLHRTDSLRSTASAGHSRGAWRTSGAARSPPAVAGTKRQQSRELSSPLVPEPASEPLLKRRRVSRTRHSLDHLSFPRSAKLHDNGQPPSPLFFSHSRRIRPHLPARFSSSEAAARMLSKTREDSGIKTVTLARGTFSGLSPPGPSHATSGRSSERSSLPPPASPEARDRNDPLRLLGSVGIVELLEQDTRPTFIVDIGDVTTHPPASSWLQILFANSALRSNRTTWELVAGKLTDISGDDPVAHASSQFKGWLLSTVIQGESLDVNPSPVEHGGIIWSCYTLRKRLRVVSGAEPGPPASSIPSTSASIDFTTHTSSLEPTPNSKRMDVSPAPPNEPQDYFGSSTPIQTVGEDTDQETQPVLSPEHVPRTEPIAANKPSIVPFQRPDRLDLPIVNDSPSFTNECVLRAHAAGDVDAFHRPRAPTPPTDHETGFFDWTRLSLSPSLPRHIQFARAIDWASTPLGPIEFWSNDLRAMCNLIM